VVSYFEWVQANQAYWWSEQEVDERLRLRMELAWRRVVAHADTQGISLRSAATSLAVCAVAEAHRTRSLYP
jgi:glutamate dehydrogenase (NAD(P)+)